MPFSAIARETARGPLFPDTLPPSRSQTQPHAPLAVDLPAPAPAPEPTSQTPIRPPALPFLPGIDIADHNQLDAWLFELDSSINTGVGHFAPDALVHIEANSMLALAHCFVDLLVHLHTPAEARRPWKNPPGIKHCNVHGVTLQSFLLSNRLFMV